MKTKSIIKIGVFFISLSFLSFKPINSVSAQNQSSSLAETMCQLSAEDGCSMNYVPVVYSYLVSNGYNTTNIQMPDCDNAWPQTVKNSVSYTTHIYLTSGIVTGHEDFMN